ncbi:helix-turn-helix transcriptional regulator [Geomicrobium sp. JCM 19039]|uniref:helix-turn-helix transcriptional regulator n=1 Tax=Geomicrobium sp. JCM 19039 TaxID=1460636 RepID=UPI00045F4654|nr:helix-turn-helix transcriptional regulator [Geomicrobium sp. JCM 19039]GAK14726.1 hypothetical protein JCM19039_4684 [Geomicrobium sp. JCM 19039]
MKFTLAQARKLNALTQKEMAKKLGMSEKQYIHYEKYRLFFRADVAYRFSVFVRLPIDQILFYDPDEHGDCTKAKRPQDGKEDEADWK